MTEEFDTEVDEESMYDYPEHREVGERAFLEGKVAAFLEYGTADGDYYEYGEHYVASEDVDELVDHDSSARVQIEVVEPLETCPDCGEEFKSVEQHQRLSECGDE